MVSEKRIDNIFKRHATAFKALEEFEKTGRVILKTRMNFTIDREMSRNFREHCKKRNKNMSELIESYMRRIAG